jgi:hypothetical protein
LTAATPRSVARSSGPSLAPSRGRTSKASAGTISRPWLNLRTSVSPASVENRTIAGAVRVIWSASDPPAAVENPFGRRSLTRLILFSGGDTTMPILTNGCGDCYTF